MPLIITKECFPPAQECANCDRKYRKGLTKKAERKELKRCAGCHFMAYCDKDCQREHWIKVHKAHCKYLSGKELVENSQHAEDSCSLCIQEKKTSRSELFSCDSPRVHCLIEAAITMIRLNLGNLFKFHKEGKSCKCPTTTYAGELPFSVGEVSGQYVGTGLDEMLAHAFKLLNAIALKGGKSVGQEEKAMKLLSCVTAIRAVLWKDILIHGIELPFESESYSKSLDDADLKSEYSSGNAWWEAVSFVMKFIEEINMANSFKSFSIKTDILNDSRFQNLKLVQMYYEEQKRNISLISVNNLWIKFKLWPIVRGDKLQIILPEGVRCSVCKASLSGPITFLPEDDNQLPILAPFFGRDGGLVACCKLPFCMALCFTRNTIFQMQQDGRWELHLKEEALMITVSRVCDLCQKRSLSCHRCTECWAAQYCSTSCQKEDLSFHKTVCEAWGKDESRKLVSGRKQRKIYKSRVEEQK